MYLALITDQLNKKDKAFLNRYKLDFHDSEVPSSFSTRSLNKFFLILQKLKVSNLTKQISNVPFSDVPDSLDLHADQIQGSGKQLPDYRQRIRRENPVFGNGLR